MRLLATGVTFIVMFACPAFGQITIVFNEVGNDVVATASGSANLFGLGTPTDQSGTAFLRASGPVNIRIGQTSAWDLYTIGVTGPTSIGSGTSSFNPVSGAGGYLVGVNSTAIILPDGYVSGTSISATSTWSDTTIAALGLTPGDYVWTWASDTLTISVVPEPSTYAAILGGLALVAVMLRRRRVGSA